MPGGVMLGGAYFELDASSAGLIQALKQAEDASKKSVAAISQQTGIAEKDVQQLAQTYIRAEQQRANASAQVTLKIIKGYNDQADAAEKATAKMASSAGSTGVGLAGLAKGTGVAAAAFIGFSSAADTARKSVDAIAASTQKHAQAQFALNALYKTDAPAIQKFSEDLAKASGRSRTEALNAATAVANLGRQYGFTLEQQKALLQISAELAAIRGITLEQAASRLSDAMRGEAEAAEYLGQTLGNDAVKAFAAMSDEQRKAFETLSPVTKAQIVFGKLVSDNADLMGKAAERANNGVGAYDKFAASVDNLSVAIGTKLSPATAAAANEATRLTDGLTAVVERTDVGKIQAIGAALLTIASPIGLIATALGDETAAKGIISALQALGAVPTPGARDSGQVFGPSVGDVKAIQAQLAGEAQDAVRGYVERVKKSLDEVADARAKAARDAAKAEDERIEQERIRLEVEKDRRLKALEETHRAAMRALDVEARAAEAAAEATIARLELEKRARIDAAEQAKDQALAAIEARREQLDGERELEDRNREDTRRYQDQLLQDRRRQQDEEIAIVLRGVEQRRQVEDRARDDRRAKDDQARADGRAKEDAALEAARTREDRRLEAVAQRLRRERELEDRERADARGREDRDVAAARERQDREEEAAHKATLARLDQERDARLKVIDDEIEAIKARKDAAVRELDEEADRVRATAEQASRDLDARHEQESRARDAAHEQATRQAAAEHEQRARAFEAEADAARDAADHRLRALDELVRAEDDRHRAALSAIDEESRRRLAAIDAELGLLDAADEADDRAAEDVRLRDAVTNTRLGVKRAESTGNQSEIIKAQQELDQALAAITRTGVQRERDARRDELKARQDAVREQARLQKEAEQEANRVRERELADTRRSVGDALAATLGGIAARKQGEADAYAAARLAADDAYRAQKMAAQDAYEAAKAAAGDALTAQLAAIAARKLALDDETTKLLTELGRRQDAERAAHEAEVGRINAAWELAKQRLADRRGAEDVERDARRVKEDRDREDARLKEDDRLNKDKLRIADRRKTEDDAIAARRGNEDRDLSERRTRDDRARSDERTAEDLRYQQAATRLQVQRGNEDRVLGERRLAEDRQRQDYRTQEDLKLSAQQAAVEAQYDAERRATEAHYNGPTGVITQVRAAMEQAKEAYRLRKEHAELQFSAERAALNLVYRSPDKKGLLDLQDEAAKNNADKLANQLAVISSWKEQAGKFIDENKAKWQSLEQAIQAVNSAIKNLPPVPTEPAPGAPGGPHGPPAPRPGQPGAPPPVGGGGAAFPVVRGATSNSYWTDQGTHSRPNGGGPAADIFAPSGTPIYAPVSGTLSSFWDSSGGNAALQAGTDGRDYYYAHGNSRFKSGAVSAGEPIGEVGKTGSAETTSPHLHYAIATSPAVFDRQGGKGDIWGDSSAWTARRSGYMFMEPTATIGLRSGVKNLVGEAGPERLLGVAQTRAFETSGRMVLPAPIAVPAAMTTASAAAANAALAAAAERRSEPQILHIPVTLGGHLLADLWIDGREQAAGQGRYSERSAKGRARTGGASW